MVRHFIYVFKSNDTSSNNHIWFKKMTLWTTVLFEDYFQMNLKEIKEYSIYTPFKIKKKKKYCKRHKFQDVIFIDLTWRTKGEQMLAGESMTSSFSIFRISVYGHLSELIQWAWERNLVWKHRCVSHQHWAQFGPRQFNAVAVMLISGLCLF